MTVAEHQDPELYCYRGSVGGVVDGDTLGDVTLDLGFGIRQTFKRCRLFGVDTPEIGKAKSDYERAVGRSAKDFVEAWTKEHPEVLVRTDKPLPDDFGRWLVTLYASDGECLNDELVALGLAVPSLDGKDKWRDTYCRKSV